MSTEKPREWFIDIQREYIEGENKKRLIYVNEKEVIEKVQVIEKQAYEALRTATVKLVEALEVVERAYPTSGERMAHQDYAAKTLAAFKAQFPEFNKEKE